MVAYSCSFSTPGAALLRLIEPRSGRCNQSTQPRPAEFLPGTAEFAAWLEPSKAVAPRRRLPLDPVTLWTSPDARAGKGTFCDRPAVQTLGTILTPRLLRRLASFPQKRPP
jgi:hypothetical protein